MLVLKNDFFQIFFNSFKMDLLPSELKKKISKFFDILNHSNYHMKYFYQIYDLKVENFSEYPSNLISKTKYGYPFIFEYECKDYLHFKPYLQHFKLNSDLSPHEFFFLYKSIMLFYELLYLKLQKKKKTL